jgi:hypothetical protein
MRSGSSVVEESVGTSAIGSHYQATSSENCKDCLM